MTGFFSFANSVDQEGNLSYHVAQHDILAALGRSADAGHSTCLADLTQRVPGLVYCGQSQIIAPRGLASDDRSHAWEPGDPRGGQETDICAGGHPLVLRRHERYDGRGATPWT